MTKLIPLGVQDQVIDLNATATTMGSYLAGLTTAAPAATGPTYQSLEPFNAIGWTAEASRLMVASFSFTAIRWTIKLDTAPGSGQSRTFTLRKNGAATALAVTISGTSTTGTVSGSISYTDLDTISVEEVNSGSPAAPGKVTWYVEIEAADSFPVMGGSGTAVSASVANYLPLRGRAAAWSTTEAGVRAPVPIAGILQNLRVKSSGPAGAAGSYACTVYVNGVASALTTSLSGTSATTAADGTHVVTVGPGDSVSFAVVPTGTPTARAFSWCVECVPNILGESFMLYGTTAAPSTSATQYEQLAGHGYAAWSATESGRQQLAPNGYTYTGIFVDTGGVAPGGVATETVGLRRNGATAFSATVTGAATSASTTGQSVAGANNDLIDLVSVPAGTPTSLTAGIHVGVSILGPTSSAATTGLRYLDDTDEEFTQKRVTARVQTLPNAATVTPNGDRYDIGVISELSQATLLNAPSGTATAGQRYLVMVQSTTSRALTYDAAIVAASGVALPSATSGSSNWDLIELTWSTVDSVWVGTSSKVTGGGGGGAVATDVIWDAAGDLAVGTGADTADKLQIGAALTGYVLTVNTAVAKKMEWTVPNTAQASEDAEMLALLGMGG